jgi:hypothetical protein
MLASTDSLVRSVDRGAESGASSRIGTNRLNLIDLKGDDDASATETARQIYQAGPGSGRVFIHASALSTLSVPKIGTQLCPCFRFQTDYSRFRDVLENMKRTFYVLHLQEADTVARTFFAPASCG